MRETFLLNEGWKFRKEAEITKTAGDDYFDMFKSNTKTGIVSGPKNASFYDGDWETVTLPHDWVIREQPNEIYSSNQGYRPQGIVWYRKHFVLPKNYEDKRIFLKFDGTAINSEIYFNNVLVAVSYGGYTPILAEVTDFFVAGSNNTVAVRADNTQKEGWWYEGGGIYRDTWLIATEDAYFEEDSVFVTASRKEDELWTVTVSSESVNADVDFWVEAEFSGEIYHATVDETISFDFENPLLWSAEQPHLYSIKVSLKKDNITYDEKIVTFGFRELRFDKDNGLFVNGKHTLLKGVCLHHDHSGVGVAVEKDVLRYRLEKLKEMGCNAIRTSHNPQSPAFYEICNQLGFYVMDEVRHFSSTEICLKELEAFLKRDRNHPCVILWSLFNEEPLQCSKTGGKIIATMIETVRKLDTTRPISGGMNGPLEVEGVVKYVDVMGFNYLQYGYDEFHKIYPDIPILGSETGSYLSVRDEAETVPQLSKISSYKRILGENLYHWSDTPGGTWKYITDRPFVAGGFYWTGVDYYGETGPFNWPGITSNFGAMDICGFPKDCYYWHKALWTKEPMLEIPQSWQGIDRETIPLVCYSNCDSIELFVNGKSLGETENNVFDPQIFTISYEAGVLKAVGKKNGKIVCEIEKKTYGKERNIIVCPSKEEVSLGDVILFDVYLTDEYGQIVKSASDSVTVRVENGEIIGSGNGDNTNHTSTVSPTQALFHGCAQWIVRANGGKTLVFEAECNVQKERVCIPVKKSGEILSLPSVPGKIYAFRYMMSDIHSDYPTPKEVVDTFYTWIPTTVGVEKSVMMSGKVGFATISGVIEIPAHAKGTPSLTIENIKGNFDVYFCKEKVYSSNGFYEGDVHLPCDELVGITNAIIGIVFHLNGEDCGIKGLIYAES